MVRVCLVLLSLLLTVPAVAQPQQLNVKLVWGHDGHFTTGFKLYKGPAVGALLKVADIPGKDTRTFTYSGVESFPVCFGISATGPAGESAVLTKDPTGVDVCLGKPQTPTGLSFSVQ